MNISDWGCWMATSTAEAIEASRVVVQRLVAARRHVGDDRSNRHLDVRRRLAFGVEEGAESFSKIGGACVETDGHVYLARCPATRWM